MSSGSDPEKGKTVSTKRSNGSKSDRCGSGSGRSGSVHGRRGSEKGRMWKIESSDSGFAEMDFLLPNGFMVALTCDRRSSLGDIKASLWEKAVQLPAANLLRNSDHYVFIGVTKDAIEEQFDDSMTIDHLGLVYPMLEVSEPKEIRDKNRLYHMVGEVIGMSIQTLDAIAAKEPEVHDLRICLRLLCHQLAQEIQNWPVERRMLFFFPAKFDLNQDLPICTARKILKADNNIVLTVWLIEEGINYKYDVTVAATGTPLHVIEAAIEVRCKGRNYSDEDINTRKEMAKHLYVLKVCGKEEYMLIERCIHTYEYIRSCINKNEVPVLQITYTDNVLRNIPDNTCVTLQQTIDSSTATPTPTVPSNSMSTWDVPHDKCYNVKIQSLPVRRTDYPTAEIYVEAQIFHGDQPLCNPIKTLTSGFNMPWVFEIGIQSLPRSARLCLMTCAVDQGKSMSEAYSINWVNVQVFDYTGKLVTGPQSLGVWESQNNKSCKRRPLGTPGGNPDKNAQVMKIEIVPPYDDDRIVVYPSDDDIDDKISREDRYSSVSGKARCLDLKKMDMIFAKDPVQSLCREEIKFLWDNRCLALEYEPNLLPKLAQSVNWGEQHDVFEFYRVLSKWPVHKLTLTTALQLLGPQYPDTRLRTLAVTVVDRTITLELLELYLLQLTQALKFESYLHNSLCRYLLNRALLNKNIGFHLFWHLRSEMHEPLSRSRFAPLLEAYCLYCGSTILEDRLGDVTELKTYSNICKEVKQAKKDDEPRDILQKWLNDQETKNALENKTSPLNSNIELGQLCLSDCKLMASKMKPLWLTFKNRSVLSTEAGKETVKYIVKSGDDLRQDMLVLQLLKVMDMVWKYACHDYWITTYACLAMGDEIGMIEVVENAQTVCNIHTKGALWVTCATMHEWIYRSSLENGGYLEAVRRFTYSCAGNCVATYIMGIGDRHSDNIMMSKSGQVFHIDFGHFMNHKKFKVGIKRERTPFVLTNDFVRVITKGESNPTNTPEFNEFLYLCYEAFMTIRRNSSLFLTLLSLMMHCNLPELGEMEDLNYCRNCLAVDKPDHEAGFDFMEKLFQSYEGQWKTKIDWFFHRFNKSMKSNGSS